MHSKALKLRDVAFGNEFHEDVEGKWVYEDFQKTSTWKKGWISMNCVYYNKEDNRLYLGITCFDEQEIFKAYDLKKKEFVDLNYSSIAEPYDAKFHRSLLKREKDGCLYGAVALLHCSDKYMEAQGGAIIKYDPRTNEITRLATPMPHVYIQATAIDEKNNIMYCQCFAPEYMISYHFETGEVKNLGLIGSGFWGIAQGENIAFDDSGNLWGCWMLTRAWQSAPKLDNVYRLFKLESGSDKITFLDTGLPKKDGTPGYEKLEALFNLGDGHMYASGANGSIYRLNTATGEATYLFTPIENRRSRLTSLVVAKDGNAYGVVGRDGQCELLKFDFQRDEYELLGKIVDDSGEACWQIHDITITEDGILYACENDSPYRSGYLWEITLNNG